MSTRRQRTAATASTSARTPLLERDARAALAQRHSTRRTCYRLLGLVAFISLFFFFIFRAPPTPIPTPANPSDDPEPVEGQFKRRIVAVGDLHGDYNNAFTVLQMANVVDANGNWTGNVDYFVQTGDIIDRSDDTIKIFKWIETLRVQAYTAGGFIFSHLGNHEFMNVLNDWRYVPSTEIATFGGVEKRQIALTTGFLGKAWAQNYTVTSRVPLHPSSGEPFTDYTHASVSNSSASSSSKDVSALSHASLSFMHGGLSPIFAQLHGTPYPSKINTLGASLLNRCRTRSPQPAPHPPAPYAGLPPGSTAAETMLYGTDGPLWYRGWAMDAEQTVCSKVGPVMEKIGVRRLIMGHTPNFKNIVSRCGGKIIIIDTGISKAYNGALSALSITYTLTPVASSFEVTPLSGSSNTSESLNSTIGTNSTSVARGKGLGKWIEREQIVALYPDRKDQLVLEEREVYGDFW